MNKHKNKILAALLLGAAMSVMGALIEDNELRLGDRIPANSKTIKMGDGRVKWDGGSLKMQFSNDGGQSFKTLGVTGTVSTGTNLLLDANFDFESGDPPGNWAASAGVFAASVGEGFDAQAGLWNSVANLDTLDSALRAVPSGLENRACDATIQYKYIAGSGGDYKLQALNSGGSVLSEVNLLVSSDWQKAAVFFTCPSADSLRVRILSTVDGSDILLDNATVGRTELSSSQGAAGVVQLTDGIGGFVGNINLIYDTVFDILKAGFRIESALDVNDFLDWDGSADTVILGSSAKTDIDINGDLIGVDGQFRVTKNDRATPLFTIPESGTSILATPLEISVGSLIVTSGSVGVSSSFTHDLTGAFNFYTPTTGGGFSLLSGSGSFNYDIDSDGNTGSAFHRWTKDGQATILMILGEAGDLVLSLGNFLTVGYFGSDVNGVDNHYNPSVGGDGVLKAGNSLIYDIDSNNNTGTASHQWITDGITELMRLGEDGILKIASGGVIQIGGVDVIINKWSTKASVASAFCGGFINSVAGVPTLGANDDCVGSLAAADLGIGLTNVPFNFTYATLTSCTVSPVAAGAGGSPQCRVSAISNIAIDVRCEDGGVATDMDFSFQCGGKL